MGMEKMLIPALLELVNNLVSMSQNVPIQRHQCKMLADLVTGIIPLLKEIERSKVPLTGPSVETFRLLMLALYNAQRVVKKMKDSSKVKLFFRSTTLNDELSAASSDIQACLSSLPLEQLRISAEMSEEIKELKAKLGDLGKELKSSNLMCRDQQALQAEITEVLRAHNTAEASSSGGGGRVMDQLMGWLAERFDSDVKTVRREWEVMKEEAVSLREQIEFTAENKRQLEDELLQMMVFIDSEERLCRSCVSHITRENRAAASELEPPKEFSCSICLQILVDPVITGSGFTYCRRCIMDWFEDNETCPHTRSRLTTKVLIENIGLRNLIARWKETSQIGVRITAIQAGPTQAVPTQAVRNSSQSSTSRSLSSDDSFDQSTLEFIDEQIRHLGERVSPEGSISSPTSPSSSTQTRVKSVTTYVSLLSSKRSMQVLKSLKELTSIASFPKGQMQVFEAGGIPAITKLLREKDSAIVEKAACVLEALTFEIKGFRDEKTLTAEERDQICSAVMDESLDTLIDLMLSGSKTARLKAAQIVINILVDEEIRAEVVLQRGVVSAFYALINFGEGFLFPGEGRSLCMKGLNLLSGEKGTGSTDDVSLTRTLLRLAALEASPQVVAESLLALSSLVEAGGESICKIIHADNGIPFLVRSISRLPSGRGKEEALKILNEMSLVENLREAIVKHELFSHLFPVLNEVTDEELDCLNEATRLLSMCLSSVRGDISLFLSQTEVKSFVGLLALERTSAASKLDILSSLHYLCSESLSLRVAFLNSAGIAALQGLAKSQIVAIKDGVAQIIKVLATFPACHKDICRQGGMHLLLSLLIDDSLECCSRAVAALECLMTGPEGSTISVDGLPLENLVELLGPMYSLQCREAAAGIFSVILSRNCSPKIVWDRKVIELLLDIVRPHDDLPLTMRKKAADVLLMITKQDTSLCSTIVEADGLPVLMELMLKLGIESKSMVIQLLTVFCKGDGNCKQAVLEAGGIKLLLEALEKGRMKEHAAIAFGNLLESVLARKTVLQAGFIERAIGCILVNGGSQCSIELTRALVTILDSKVNAAKVRDSEGVQALVLVLEGGDEIGKKVAATALTKLIRLDPDSSSLLGQVDGITALWKLLLLQESEASSEEVEALEALSAASEEQNNKMLIVQEGGIPVLLSISSRGSSRSQELALTILLKLSREGPAPLGHDICATLIKEKISRHIFQIVQIQSETSVSEKAIHSAICIIRNLSLSGTAARMTLLDEGEGAIKVLLERIRFHKANGCLDIVQVAVIAVERFMLDSRGKMALIREGGIGVIVQILQHGMGTPGKAKSFATKILVMVAQDPHASREVCNAIFEANVVPGLRDILEYGPNSECKRQAATLLKFLMFAGPRAAVCKCIREEGCIPKLLDLRADVLCLQAATDALDLLKSYDKESRKQIIEADNHPWCRSLSVHS